MVAAWSIYLSLWLPIPLISVILLTTFGQWGPVVRACSNVNGMRVRIGSKNHMSLRAICFAVAFLVFGLTTRSSIDAQIFAAGMATDVSPNVRVSILSKKWRAERNFWISALILALWYVLGGLLRLRVENAELRSRLVEVKEPTGQETSKKSKKEE